MVIYSNKINMDKFYTNPDIAKICIDFIDLSKYDLIIEPSAGSGSFSNNINNDTLLALDILPENDNIIQCNWFEFNLKNEYNNILVIGNPPFGIRNKLSKAFVEKAIEINAKTIAFILPNVYDKHTLQSIFPSDYRLVHKYRLPKNSFIADGKEIHIPCTFYVWDKSIGEDLRFNPNLYKTDDFEFISKSESNNDDFFIFGASPNTVKEICEIKKTNRGYYIRPKEKSKKELMKIFTETKFDALSSVSGGVAWRTKPEIIKSYIKGDLI